MSGFFGGNAEVEAEELRRAGMRPLLFDPSALGGEPGTFIKPDRAHPLLFDPSLFDPSPLGGEPGRFVPREAKPGTIKPTPRKPRKPSEDPAGREPGSGVWGPIGWW